MQYDGNSLNERRQKKIQTQQLIVERAYIPDTIVSKHPNSRHTKTVIANVHSQWILALNLGIFRVFKYEAIVQLLDEYDETCYVKGKEYSIRQWRRSGKC